MNLPPAIRKLKLPILIIVVAVALIYLLMITRPEPAQTTTQEKEWLVDYENISPGSATPQIILLGTVESPVNAMLSAALSADVAAVPAREGQKLSKGDVLVQLDDREIRLAIDRAEADIADIQAQIEQENNRFESDQQALEAEKKLLEIAEKSLDRQSRLQAADMVAKEGYDQAEAQRARSALSITAREQSIANHPARLKQLQARLKQARSRLENARIDLERTEVRAPFDARVTEVHVSPGERVQPGQSMVRLYDLNNTEVRAQVPDRDVALIRETLAREESISGSGSIHDRKIELVLDRLSGQANPRTGGIDALFKPVESATPLMLNSSIELTVALPDHQGVATVPVSAVYGNNRIYRIDDSQRLEALSVEMLGTEFSTEGQDRRIIRHADLHAGDRIITTQLPNAIEGLKVKLKSDRTGAGE